jgi:hypothetical protein
MDKGQQSWIRVRGAPNDPESFDLASWNGYAWIIERVNSLGETIYVQIPSYLVIETMPPSAKPEDIYSKETKN